MTGPPGPPARVQPDCRVPYNWYQITEEWRPYTKQGGLPRCTDGSNGKKHAENKVREHGSGTAGTTRTRTVHDGQTHRKQSGAVWEGHSTHD